ncbi:alpha-L-fucosidase [Patella vulgata]|uniref:alpha-L-fucosidase n=1 Tax=Patella vulgata TaxID=6465 RepID=UPI0024A7D2A8|nr:alpha-L-fucosidase [Patella vulgata]
MNFLGRLCFIITVSFSIAVRYEPNWPSIDSRPLPTWFDEAKFGIYIHWGIYSVPSYSPDYASEWFWWYWQGQKIPAYVDFMKRNYPPDFTYADFAPLFTAEFFDPNEWAEIFQAAGAEYVILTTKHHEGFTLWPSEYSFNWNSMAVGPKRDLVGTRWVIKSNTSLHFGLYHSLFEWFHPLYLKDKENNFTTTAFVDTKTMPELYEIINTYQPEIIESDGDWEANSSYWKSTEFLAWLYNDSPVKDTVVTNDRWGKDATCHHGGYLTCNDRYQPGHLLKRKWETGLTIDRKSWGFRRNANLSDYLTTQYLISTFAETVSLGGNFVINVGPTKEGVISPIAEERLREFGSWMKVNEEAIKGSKPWSTHKDAYTLDVWYV